MPATDQCTLCDYELPKNPVVDGEKGFCCSGCHAVFNILVTKNQLENYQKHPIFQQAMRSGLISNPALLEEIRNSRPDVPEEEMEKLHLEIGEMWCPSCAEVIRLMLLKEPGVRNCVVDYATDLASIEFAPRYISKERLMEIISSLGYQPVLFHDPNRKAVGRNLLLRLAIAAFCALNIMMFSYPIYASYFNTENQGYARLFAWVSFFASLPVLTYSAFPIFRRFLTSLKVGIFGMETLVVLGVSTAFGLSCFELWQGGIHVYFDSMAMIITLVLLGKVVEAKAKFSAKDSLLRLNRSVPRRGRKRFFDGTEQFVPMKELQPGDTVIACSGEKVVLDGVIIEGEGACDESLMTGEAIPVVKKTGSGVLGGTILQQGWIAYRVVATAEESALHKIIEMVEHDIGHKSSYVRAADPVVRWFVPVVVTLALSLLFLPVADPWTRAISVLLISCPCAIGIAAPLAESRLLNGLARLGAIVRNRGCLLYLGKETVFLFDKTGTITEGHFRLMGGLETLTSDQRSLLKGLASHSTHPVAAAVVQGIQEDPLKPSYVEEVVGRGLRGTLGDKTYYFGSSSFMDEHEVSYSSTLSPDAIVSLAFFAEERHCLATLSLGDTIREGAKDVVKSMSPTRSVLLSGDSPLVVEAVAQHCGFDEWRAECSPLNKRDVVDTFRNQGEVVTVLGDGINDAPALTGAHVGISVVNATDISIQVSDILLTTDRLGVVTKIRTIARKGQKIIRQNLFWAFFYNVVGIGLAVAGVLTPLFAAFAMVLSSLIVLLNAHRLG